MGALARQSEFPAYIELIIQAGAGVRVEPQPDLSGVLEFTEFGAHYGGDLSA